MPAKLRVMIRLARHGCTNRPFYHVVAIHNRRGRDSRAYLEQLGTFDPMPNQHDEKLVSFDFERVKYWMARGAVPTRPVAMLLGLSGFLPLHPMSTVLARRAKAKAEERARKAAEENEEEVEAS